MPGLGAKTLRHLDPAAAWPELALASRGWQVGFGANGQKARQEHVGANYEAGPAGQTVVATRPGGHPPRAAQLMARSQYIRASCGRQKVPKYAPNPVKR